MFVVTSLKMVLTPKESKTSCTGALIKLSNSTPDRVLARWKGMLQTFDSSGVSQLSSSAAIAQLRFARNYLISITLIGFKEKTE